MKKIFFLFLTNLTFAGLTLGQMDTTSINSDEKEISVDYNSNRLFIMPTAIPMKTLQGYIQINQFVVPFAAIGIENLIVIGGGISPLFPELYYLSPRITPIHFDNIYLAGGYFFVSSYDKELSWSGFPIGFGIAYGLATYSTKKFSITLGIANQTNKTGFKDNPFLILGGDITLHGNTKLMIECWQHIPETDEIFLMIGMRMSGKYFSGDVSLIKMFGNGNSLIPWVSVTYNFDFLHK